MTNLCHKREAVEGSHYMRGGSVGGGAYLWERGGRERLSISYCLKQGSAVVMGHYRRQSLFIAL